MEQEKPGPTIPKKPTKDQRVDCYLRIDDNDGAFWVDGACTPGRIKKCLYEMQHMDPLTTTLKLGNKKLLKEKPLISHYGLKNGDVIRVIYNKTARFMLAQINRDTMGVQNVIKKEFMQEECLFCFEKLEKNINGTNVFIPCGHICVCDKCMTEKLTMHCPICNRINE